MTIALSHFEIRTRDLPRMEAFYTGALGFLATDRSADGTMVFLSADPSEHHQIVLAEAAEGSFASGSLDHLAFRVADLVALRRYHEALQGYGDLAVETVSHGTSWSVYFRDPEGNRLELFVDTPWHVAQPLRFPIDLSMPDQALIAWTKERISGHADFQPATEWFDALERRLGKVELGR
jgi:catechol 2,3-dioxygenase-like lactoylglutathione lyase family enzyme